MARYLTLLRFTDQGARAVRRSVARGRAFRAAAARAGVTVEAQYWTTGAHDGVVILSGDEKRILQCLARLLALGNVRTETLRAFDAAECKQLLT